MHPGKNNFNEYVPLPAAEASLATELKRLGIDQFVTVPRIKEWIYDTQQNETGHLDLPYLTLLTGLVDMDIDGEDLQSLTRAIITLYRVSPQRALGGKSPEEKSREPNADDKRGRLIINQTSLHSMEWHNHAVQAHDYFLAGKNDQALAEYEQLFESLLKDKTTYTEPYRFFTNAALAHFQAGDRYIGETLVNIALELNPNYDFGIQVKTNLADGKYSKTIAHGWLASAVAKLADKNHPLNRWDFDKITTTWSTKKILAQLAEFGIIITEPEFRDLAKDYVWIDDFCEEHLRPRYLGSKQDVDFVWVAGHALFAHWGADYFTVNGWWHLIEVLEQEVFEGDARARPVEDLLIKIERYAVKAPPELWSRWKRSYEYNYAETLVDCVIQLLDTPLAPRWILVSAAVGRLVNDNLFLLPGLLEQYHLNDNQWREQFFKLFQNYFTSVTPYLLAADFACQHQHEPVIAEKLLLAGIAATEAREHSKTEALPNDEPLFHAYNRLLGQLSKLYEEMNEKNKRRAIEQRLKDLEKLSDKLDSRTSDTDMAENMANIMEKHDQERLKQHPAYRYYQWLKPFGINFITTQLTTSEITQVRLSDGAPKKIGRNDPCSCGSGKKYKKCCLEK